MDQEPSSPPSARRRAPGGFFAGMRVRKKILFLHTCFSLGLAVVLLLSLRPAITEIVEQAELNEASLILAVAVRGGLAIDTPPPGESPAKGGAQVEIRRGTAGELGLSAGVARDAMDHFRTPRPWQVTPRSASAVLFVPSTPDVPGHFVAATVSIPEARRAVTRLYALLAGALLAVYVLVAAALEVFVLPRHVYRPIRRLLEADRAVQEGRREEEIIPEDELGADELGEIMRSRNRSIVSLRASERDLADALARLEVVATDLRRKNHLLETAKRNLADADRLASLGMMSAGIAHELNTPLAVLKGLVERLDSSPGGSVSPADASLMLRVVRRLERLGESLLDFARARPAQTRQTSIRALVDEAATLVRLDREAARVEIRNHVPADLVAECDPDRLVQVMVNLLRNGVDAVREGRARSATRPGANGPAIEGVVLVRAESAERDGSGWVSITVADDGPGIDPEVLPRLFEPFVSTRLDHRGTGLGLAVVEGIVREHGGLVLARNRADQPGAVFEVMIPARQPRRALPRHAEA